MAQRGHKKPRNKEVPQGKMRSEQYSSKEEALEMARELEAKSDHKFIVQRSFIHRDKWVIIEY